MEIAIFKELTTNEHLDQLKAESEKYTGLYVDMSKDKERKYVKDKADGINQLLKKVERKRINASKEYKIKVEAEAADITERLEIANLPFTLLIDEYKEERKKILDAEKARKQAVLDAEQKELDHEMALLINKTYEFDKAEAARIQDEELKRIMAAADKAADERQKQSILDGLERERNAENARLANKEHVRSINLAILKVLLDNGISEKDAKTMVTLAAKRELPNLIINY